MALERELPLIIPDWSEIRLKAEREHGFRWSSDKGKSAGRIEKPIAAA
jgi:hypothetical protein